MVSQDASELVRLLANCELVNTALDWSLVEGRTRTWKEDTSQLKNLLRWRKRGAGVATIDRKSEKNI